MDFIERNANIEKRYLKGETLKSIGNSWHITRERVRQILEKRGIDPKAGGIALARRINPPKCKQPKASKRTQYPEGFRLCHKCGKLDKVENFYKAKRVDGGYSYLHKPCRNAYMKKYFESKKGANEKQI